MGPFAFGKLSCEIGVHGWCGSARSILSSRRHTSFAAVDCIPMFEDDIDIEIKEEDLRIDFYRASGAGGQHVNKISSAVRITHVPTGIVVQCQNERSQHKNRAQAMKMLKAKLYMLEQQKRDAEMAKLYGDKGQIAWGNQIRSYVLQPYQMVKDHRTDHQTGNVDAVLDGEIEDFIESYLQSTRQNKTQVIQGNIEGYGMKEIIKVSCQNQTTSKSTSAGRTCYVIGMFSDAARLDAGSGYCSTRSSKALSSTLMKLGDFKGKEGTTAVVYGTRKIGAKRVMLAGLGEKEEADAGQTAQGGRCREQRGGRSQSKAIVTGPPPGPARKIRRERVGQVLAEGACFGSYRYDEYVTKSENGRLQSLAVELVDQ